jgi:hypothetical protein
VAKYFHCVPIHTIQRCELAAPSRLAAFSLGIEPSGPCTGIGGCLVLLKVNGKGVVARVKGRCCDNTKDSIADSVVVMQTALR